MKYKYSLMCFVAIIMLSSISLVTAQDIKCAWESCGTRVAEADVDPAYALIPIQATFAFFDYNNPSGSSGVFDDSDTMYVDMNNDGRINPGDVRITPWHNVPLGDDQFKYPANTKVGNDEDQNLPLVTPGQAGLITYMDINSNGVYDLADPLYVDTDYSTTVSTHDIRLTTNAWGYQPYTTVTVTDDDDGKALVVLGAGIPAEMLGYIDDDCSGSWTCSDKLYLQQPALGPDPSPNSMLYVTIGDHRLYIPQAAIDDEGWPSCGTKVEQADMDAVYVLATPLSANGSQIIQIGWFDYMGTTGVFDDEDTVYVDMNGDGLVNPGDVRLTPWHNDPLDTKYPANTKVDNDEDQNLPLVTPSQANLVTFYNENSMYGYDLGDPVYLDMDGNGVVTTYDVRLTPTAGYAAYTSVKASDADRQEVRALIPIGTGIPADLIGYIDSDCTGTWSCPDKLYLEQPALDWQVTIGDVRLYIPQDAIDNEAWPSCGTKVEQCDIDAVYRLKNFWTNNGAPQLMFYDYTISGTVGVFDNSDTLYLDMDANNVISANDVRLTPWHNVPEDDADFKYAANTKVFNDADLNKPLRPIPGGFAYFNINGQYGFDLGDPIYVDVNGDGTVSLFDVRLTPTAGFDAYTTVRPGDDDLGEVLLAIPPEIGYIDSDCSNTWSCPDKLYLEQISQLAPGANGIVSIGDMRLYIPPSEIGPVQPGPCDEYDTNGQAGIQIDEAVTAVVDYFDNKIDLDTAVAVVVCYFD